MLHGTQNTYGTSPRRTPPLPPNGDVWFGGPLFDSGWGWFLHDLNALGSLKLSPPPSYHCTTISHPFVLFTEYNNCCHKKQKLMTTWAAMQATWLMHSLGLRTNPSSSAAPC